MVRAKVARSWLLLAALAVFWYLSSQVTAAWWRWDDPQILLHARSFAPWESYLSPSVWRSFSAAHLTPWLTTSFDIDLTLFGLSPARFYDHQVISLTLVCVMLYVVARLYFGRAAALAAPAVFVLSPVAVGLVQQLMTRHYVEGLLFSLLAVWSFVNAVRRGSVALSVLAGVSYLLAASSKEIYVPLAILIAVLPESTWRRRLLYALPIFVSAAFYVAWRAMMLGVAVGGYGKAVDLHAMLVLPSTALAYLFGPHWGPWLLLAVLGLALHHAVRQRSMLGPALLVCALAPLVPVVNGFSADLTNLHMPRFLTVVVVLLAFVASRAVDLVSRLAVAPMALFGVLLVVLIPLAPRGALAAHALAQQGSLLEVQGRFLWNQREPGVLWAQMSPFHHYIVGLRELGSVDNVDIVADEIEFDARRYDGAHVWKYSSQCDCVADRGPYVESLMDTWRARLRKESLSARFGLSRTGVVSWSLGPYDNGRYSLINGEIFGKLTVPSKGGVRTGLRRFEVIVRFDSAEGWTTYSTPIAIDFVEASDIHWSRGQAKGANDE